KIRILPCPVLPSLSICSFSTRFKAMKAVTQKKDNQQANPVQRQEDAVQTKMMAPPPFALDASPAQMKGEEEEEAMQAKMAPSSAPAQMMAAEEEEGAGIQMKADPAQMMEAEEEEGIQMKADPAQMMEEEEEMA
ncbi:MAG: hypothetical protein AAF570_15680, partial [Bacteroidota bacterium]